MTESYLRCVTDLNILTLNLTNKTLFSIDNYTITYETEDELKEDFKLAFPMVKPLLIDHGGFYIERNGENLDVIYKSKEFIEMHKYIKVNEKTDEIEDTMPLRQYIVSLFMRFGHENISALVEEGHINTTTYKKICEFKDASTKSRQLRELRHEQKTLNYYYLRDFVFTLNKYLKIEKNNSKTI